MRLRILSSSSHLVRMLSVATLTGATAFLLTACSPGYSPNPTNTTVPTTPAVSPYACGLLPLAQVATVLGAPSTRAVATLYSTPYIEISANQSFGGGSGNPPAGQCHYHVSSGEQLVLTVYPDTPLPSLGAYLSPAPMPSASLPATYENGTIQYTPTSALVIFEKGGTAYEIALDRVESAAQQARGLKSLEAVIAQS